MKRHSYCRAHTVGRTSNIKISRGHLADYVTTLHQRGCCTHARSQVKEESRRLLRVPCRLLRTFSAPFVYYSSGKAYRSHAYCCCPTVIRGMSCWLGCGIFIPVTFEIHRRWFTTLVYTPYLFGTPHPVCPNEATPVKNHLPPSPWHIRGPVKLKVAVRLFEKRFLVRALVTGSICWCRVIKPSLSVLLIFGKLQIKQNQIRWNVVLVRGENQSTSGKTSRSRVEKQQSSHYFANPASKMIRFSCGDRLTPTVSFTSVHTALFVSSTDHVRWDSPTVGQRIIALLVRYQRKRSLVQYPRWWAFESLSSPSSNVTDFTLKD